MALWVRTLPLGTWVHILAEQDFDNLILSQKKASIYTIIFNVNGNFSSASRSGAQKQLLQVKLLGTFNIFAIGPFICLPHGTYQWYHLCSCAILMRAKYSHDVLATEEKPFIPNWWQGHSISMNPHGNRTTVHVLLLEVMGDGLTLVSQREILHACKCWLHVEPQWVWSF